MPSANALSPSPNLALTAAEVAAITDAIISAADSHEAGMQSELLPILHALQDRLGHIPAEAVPRIAKALNLSRAEVHGVVTFYHDFRTTPRGEHSVRVCLGEACQAIGAQPLREHAETKLTVALGGTTTDQKVTLEPTYCFGNCACGPSVMVDGTLHGRVTADRFDALVAPLQGAKS